MNIVKPGKVYRHYKGNYYYIENVVLDSETARRLVIYKALYGDSISWSRPEDDFLAEVPESSENITSQKHRFEEVTDLTKDYRR